MKHIAENYSPQKRFSMHRWFWRSTLLLTALCLGMILISMQQHAAYHDILRENVQLKSVTADLHACLERKRELKERIEVLDARLTKLNDMKYHPKNPGLLLQTLDSIPDIKPHHIVLKKNKLDLVIYAADTERILLYADHLKGQEFCADVAIASIDQTGDRIKAALHVTLR